MASSDSLLKGLGYGAFASMLGDLVTMPVDVTKTRMQLQGPTRLYKNALDCALQTAKGEGVTSGKDWNRRCGAKPVTVL